MTFRGMKYLLTEASPFILHRFASMLYTSEGQAITQRVWDETLAELDFAGARDIAESLKGV